MLAATWIGIGAGNRRQPPLSKLQRSETCPDGAEETVLGRGETELRMAWHRLAALQVLRGLGNRPAVLQRSGEGQDVEWRSWRPRESMQLSADRSRTKPDCQGMLYDLWRRCWQTVMSQFDASSGLACSETTPANTEKEAYRFYCVNGLRHVWNTTYNSSNYNETSPQNRKMGGGGIMLIVGFQPLMVISPTASWIRWCMQVWTANWYRTDIAIKTNTGSHNPDPIDMLSSSYFSPGYSSKLYSPLWFFFFFFFS